MMKPLITFLISEFQQIRITMNAEAKVNTYGYETDALHIFDEVEVEYVNSDKKISLASDIVRYVVKKLETVLEKSLKDELPLKRFISVGRVGYFFSKKKYMTVDESDGSEKHDIFLQYWVWSSPTNIQTWLYNATDKIYLEISPTYPWLFSDSDEEESYMLFDDYMKNYKPITLIELPALLVQEWLTQCHEILQKMENPKS